MFKRATALAAAAAGLAVAVLLAPLAGARGEVEVAYSHGEVSVDEDGVITVNPSSALGIELSHRTAGDGRSPELDFGGFLTLSGDAPAKAGVTLEAAWEPGSAGGRRYTLAGSLAQRRSDGDSAPEQAWKLTAAVHESGLRPSALEAGGRLEEHHNRLSGRDYRESAAYLATRVALDSAPRAFSWLEPEWFSGFAALLVPPPEPGAEDRTDLPAWYEKAALAGLPALPALFGTAATEAVEGRLTVSARHTQTARTYEGGPESDWEAGESSLEVTQRVGRGEVTAGYSSTLKHYPQDPEQTYRLAEGKLAAAFPAGRGRGRAAASFRNRFPWEGGSGAYRQAGLSLGCSFPGESLDWRLGGEWRRRDYLDGAGEDHATITVEGEASWAEARRARGLAATAGASFSVTTFPATGKPAEYRLRWRLRGVLPAGPDRSITAGLAWETRAGTPGELLASGPAETLFRLSWTRRF